MKTIVVILLISLSQGLFLCNLPITAFTTFLTLPH